VWKARVKKAQVKLDAKKHRKYATHLQHCIDKFRQGRYSNSLDFLFAVSHFTDNVTQPLDNDDDEETEDYDIDDFFRRT